MSAETTIQPMADADLGAAGKLLEQLGYTIEPDEVKHRFDEVTAASGNLVLVAAADDAVRGWSTSSRGPPWKSRPKRLFRRW